MPDVQSLLPQLSKLSLGNLSNITKLGGKDLGEFAHLVIDELCGLKAFPIAQYGDLDVKSLVNSYRAFYKQVVNNDLKKEQILSELKNGGVAEDKSIVLCDAIISRWGDVRKEAINNSSAIGNTHLVDFDWKIHLVLSSDKIANVQQSKLLLNLYVTEPLDPTKREEVLVELTKEELDQLLVTFGKINQTIQDLKV
eukprot:TRINITY_DN9002_c0_g1_i1.p1 TRINITY_DN9002_c0_g1~~TRINITY_DN9002_c0_g1_i1.p1  ORF type:complete len:196 (-),score=46.00 TRINITY_DN9002_c0_g1_i1:96-683(-)